MTCWNSISEIDFSVHERSHANMRNDTVVRFRKKDEVVDLRLQVVPRTSAASTKVQAESR